MIFATAVAITVLPHTGRTDQLSQFATAPSACAPRHEIESTLKSQYHEELVAEALPAQGPLIVEHWTSSGGATWTIILRHPSGMSCLLAAGREWHGMAPSRPGT
ncbi:MAG: hypothetical protein ACREGL_10440 [Alphaproteobacteria bacterium]